MIFFSNRHRPFHYGPYPLERLARDARVGAAERGGARVARPEGGVAAAGGDHPCHSRAYPQGHKSGKPEKSGGDSYRAAVAKYHALFRRFRDGEVARARAPVPDDLSRRAVDIKGAAYFLDADQVGICALSPSCWYRDAAPAPHSHGIVVVVEHGRLPEHGNPARGWLQGALHATARMRAFEIAVGIADHIRNMGFAATADDDTGDALDIARLTVLAGLGIRERGKVINPYFGSRYAVAVVSAGYALACDTPLAARAKRGRTLAWWLGVGGAVPGLERHRRAARRTDLGRYPMEQLRRCARPTTLILDDEVPRVPKRAGFFDRAAHGDLGDKARHERQRFAFKHPFAQAMTRQIGAMVPFQDGPVAGLAATPAPAETAAASSFPRKRESRKESTPAAPDAAANSRALKSLSYALGADITGICAIPDYAWYSHDSDGAKIEPQHRYAVVCLIDQGYDTMEGASGDDFISGAQSMRAYMRGALLAGIMAEHIRALGYPARSQTNADSQVLHIPLLLWAGLGELSRIGELVLNPFIGPRFKTVVLTTDMPLLPDKPIDFGLQYFCSSCRKCARECPCDAISFGDKVMFNGYEMWKPDVERCARYRLTNQRGLACGRCMKTCPLNKVIGWDGPLATQIASWCGINAPWLKPLLVPIAVRLDDLLGHGVRNSMKKWWLDLEIIDGVCVHPPRGVNRRDLNIKRKIEVGKHKIAYYHAAMMPPPNSAGIAMAVKRKDGLAAAAEVETVAAALARKAAGGDAPAHYTPTPPMDADNAPRRKVAASPYEIARKGSPE